MHIDLYERFWMWGSAVIIAVFLVSMGATTFGAGLTPPSHVETIDPTSVPRDPRFAQPGVTINPDGSATVVVISLMFAFVPNEVRVPRGVPVTFRVTSPDVIHGFQIVRTNGNTIVAPGYVSQFTTRFEEAGEYLIVCNEFCGLGHHAMFAKLLVEDGPAASAGGTASAGGAP